MNGKRMKKGKDRGKGQEKRRKWVKKSPCFVGFGREEEMGMKEKVKGGLENLNREVEKKKWDLGKRSPQITENICYFESV